MIYLLSMSFLSTLLQSDSQLIASIKLCCKGIRKVASHDDYAKSEDCKGFGKYDVEFGHYLARVRKVSEMSRNTIRKLAKMTIKYRKQINDQSILDAAKYVQEKIPELVYVEIHTGNDLIEQMKVLCQDSIQSDYFSDEKGIYFKIEMSEVMKKNAFWDAWKNDEEFRSTIKGIVFPKKINEVWMLCYQGKDVLDWRPSNVLYPEDLIAF